MSFPPTTVGEKNRGKMHKKGATTVREDLHKERSTNRRREEYKGSKNCQGRSEKVSTNRPGGETTLVTG